MYYDPRDINCKNPFGAVKCDERVTFNVFGNANCVILILKTDVSQEYIKMEKNGDRFTTTITKPIGIYFYEFQINGEYIFNNKSEPWQLTVYDKDFTVPDTITGGIIYQIFPDRFCRGRTPGRPVYDDRYFANWDDEPTYTPVEGNEGNKKVINNDYFGGNMQGIISKLDYLKDLSVTAIYLNPIFEAHSNHRYNTADYMKIDPMLGTLEDFKELCEKAKSMGIKIILDGVFSHTGDDSVYFNKKGRYNTIGAYQSEQSQYSKWYQFKTFPDEYKCWWGFKTLPDVNENEESYTDFICGENGVISYWIKNGASGFRLDVADELPDEFLQNIRKSIKKADENAILIGEVWEDASNKISYGKRREFLLGKQLDTVMNYPFRDAIIDFIKNGGGENFTDNIMKIVENYPEQSLHSLMNIIGTHDTERILTALAGESCENKNRDWQAKAILNEQEYQKGVALLKIAIFLQYTLPGIPSIYYGDERGMQGYKDPFNRKTINWDKYDDELLNWYKTLGKIHSNEVFAKGEFLPIQAEKDFIAYIRKNEEKEVFIMINRSSKPYEAWLLPGWQNDKTLIGSNPENGIQTIPPYSCAMMSRG